jgi:hypothetical protein
MRAHKSTSKAGENFIAPFKQSHKDKILEALKKLKVGGTHEEISEACGLRPDQVWKRISEVENIYDSGITRKLKSGLDGIVWKLREETLQEFLTNYQNEQPPARFYQSNLFP